MPSTTSPLAPFRHPVFRSLWIATLASNLGSLIQGVGAGWMMTSLTSSHDMVALVQASNSLPVVFLALIAGAFADGFDRRKVMLAAQIFMLVVSAMLAIAAYRDGLTPWILLAFTFLLGCGGAMHQPSWQASVRDIVPKEDLAGAISLNSMSFNMMRSVGPAIGGLIVATAGAAAAFAVNALSYLAVIVALFRWQRPREPRDLPREALAPAMSAGLRYVAMSPNILTVLGRAMAFSFSAVSVLALLPIVARDMLQGGPLTYGVLLGAFGLGAIGGALSTARLRGQYRLETIIRGAFLQFAAGVAVLGLSPWLGLSLIALLASGAAWVVALSLFNVSVQMATPRWVVGRVLAMHQMAVSSGMALGAWVWGSLSDATGPEMALVASALFLMLGAGLGLRFALPEMHDLNLDPNDRFSAPALKLSLKARSGPIMVMVDYDIAPENVPEFLRLMTARRRIRIRDGARQWVLLRDLENPDLWSESYHVATWVDYLRHNQRRTQADVELYDQLLALHRGPGRPRVHRMIERQTVPLHDDMPIIHNPKVL